MVKFKDLETHTYAKLYELREVWFQTLNDWYDNSVAYGAQTRKVGDDQLRGIFSNEKKAQNLKSRIKKDIASKINEGDRFDKMRFISVHNLPIEENTGFGYELLLEGYNVPIEEIEERNGVLYWNRPLLLFDKDLVKEGVVKIHDSERGLSFYEPNQEISYPICWIFPNIERDKAKLIQIE
ncbi:MAG: hypothetical protein WC867_01970 [Candidatus Pacearchaeota archaeon]|jgi:hypothetical protein